jgi:MraZ protein
MRFFTGQYERSIDEKNRIQLPSQLRNAINQDREGGGLYITLGEERGTLSIFTERGFEEVAGRLETEFMPGADSARFELQFFGLASYADVDPQGRFVLPDRLVKKARLGKEVFLMGRKNRIEVWNREHLDRAIGIDWEGDDWPDWQGYLRMRPEERGQGGPRSSDRRMEPPA